MEPVTFTDYTSYDIQKHFITTSFNPAEGWLHGPTRCLHCAGTLSETRIEPSRAMRELISHAEDMYWLDHGSSFLHTCKACHWWCIREHYEFVIKQYADHKFGYDYLIVAEKPTQKSASSIDPPAQPWLRALDDGGVHKQVQNLPDALAQLFTPHKRG